MMAEQTKRNKPKFKRQGWSKMIKLGKGVKKNRKWKKPRGRDSKVRLKERGYATKVSIGWGSCKKNKKEIIKVENLKQIEDVKKEQEIIIGKVGRKKREEILKNAKEKGIKVLNRYKTENKQGGEGE